MRTKTSPQSHPSHAEPGPRQSNLDSSVPVACQEQQQVDEDAGDDHETATTRRLTHAHVTDACNNPAQSCEKQTRNIQQKIDNQGEPHATAEEEEHDAPLQRQAVSAPSSARLKRERAVTFDPSIPTSASDITAVATTTTSAATAVAAVGHNSSSNDNRHYSSPAIPTSTSGRPSLLPPSSSSSSSSSFPLHTLLPPRTRCPALPPLIPPFRYCAVEDGVYRGAYPSLKNLRFMQRLRLRTLVSLIPERDGQPTRDLADFCLAHHVRHVHYQVDKYDDGFSHTDQLVASIVAQLIDPANHPLFIHCRDGAHNTGIVVMCLRRLQNWTLQAIYEEFVRYTKSNDITFEEKQFVESFHAKVSIPPRVPPWLWDGVRRCKHPCIQLVLMPSQAQHRSLNVDEENGRSGISNRCP